ncbi:3'-5' exonuclease, partial [Planococcus sp. SIMBA_143]
RTEEECEQLYQKFAKEKDVNLLTKEDRSYEGDISIVPIYLTKGLEFDGVIIANANERNYGSNVEDAKLLYVGCTRALHELNLFYTEGPST